MCDSCSKKKQSGKFIWAGAAMLKEDLPKSVKKALRALRDLAYEAELRRALTNLSQNFERWKAGGISSFDLADRIHEFHDGPNRKLYLLYTGRLDLRFLVSRAVQEGLIKKESIPKEVLPYLQKAPSF